jgi:hypothetical protein
MEEDASGGKIVKDGEVEVCARGGVTVLWLSWRNCQLFVL